MKKKLIRNGALALGILAGLAGMSVPASAAAVGITSARGLPVAVGTDSWDNITLQSIENTGNEVVFKITLDGGDFNLSPTSAFTYFTDASHQIRDVLYGDIADNGDTSTLYFSYSAHGNFGTVAAPVGSIVDPQTLEAVSLTSLPTIAGVSEQSTHASGGYVVNADLRNVTTGEISAFVPYLAVYVFADEAPTPEPATLFVLPIGLLAVIAIRKRR